MTSIISPFSNRNNKDRIQQKFAPVYSDNDLVFIRCEKHGKIVSIGISRRDYKLREEQIANGLISESALKYSLTEI